MIVQGTDISVIGGIPDKDILVIARNYVRFITWCRNHAIDYKSRNVIFVWGIPTLQNAVRGKSDIWFVDLGVALPREAKTRFYDVLEHFKDAYNMKEIPHG